MYAALTAEELLEWEWLYAIDPWGEYRADLRSGLLCSLTDACHRTRGQASRPLDYMPIVRALEKPIAQTEESMKGTIEAAFRSWGRKK